MLVRLIKRSQSPARPCRHAPHEHFLVLTNETTGSSKSSLPRLYCVHGFGGPKHTEIPQYFSMRFAVTVLALQNVMVFRTWMCTRLLQAELTSWAIITPGVRVCLWHSLAPQRTWHLANSIGHVLFALGLLS